MTSPIKLIKSSRISHIFQIPTDFRSLCLLKESFLTSQSRRERTLLSDVLSYISQSTQTFFFSFVKGRLSIFYHGGRPQVYFEVKKGISRIPY